MRITYLAATFQDEHRPAALRFRPPRRRSEVLPVLDLDHHSDRMTSNHIRSVWLVLVACAIAFGPYIPLLKQFSVDPVAHPQPYPVIAIGMTVIGLGLFIVVGIVSAIRGGRRMVSSLVAHEK
jgi:hypothetical protein